MGKEENKIKKAVKEYLDLNDWFHFPVIQNFTRHSVGMPGVSDRIACKRGIVLFVEIKAPGKTLMPSQIIFKKNILGQNCYYVEVDDVLKLDQYIKGISKC